MLSDYFLVSALARSAGFQGSSLSGLFAPLAAAATSRTSLAQAQLTRSLDADKARLAGYEELIAAVRGFQNAVRGFDSADEINSAVAASSDAAVATATAAAGAGSGVYDLAISALARAQTAVSGAFADSDTAIVGSGTLTIQLGEYDADTNTFTPGETGPVQIDITSGTLDDIATAINAAGAGVTASVVETDGEAYLSLTSSATGAANGFSLTVADADGDDTDMDGLSRLAFDPEARRNGKNLTQTQAAQDAAFTINGIAASSASNGAVTIAPGVTVSLLQTGSTTISVTQSAAALTAAAQDFVDAYNTLQGEIAELTGRDGALAGDALAARLAAALEAPLSDSFATGGAFDYLYQIGITPQPDGTLALDEAALQSAFAADAAGATALLNEVAQDFDAVIDPYARGGGTIEAGAKAFQHDVLYLEKLLPSLQQIAEQTQAYADSRYAGLVAQLYAATLGESLFASFPAKAFSIHA